MSATVLSVEADDSSSSASTFSPAVVAACTPQSPDSARQSARLLGLVEDFALFQDDSGTGYAVFGSKAAPQTWPITSRVVADVIIERYLRDTNHAPGEQALREALRTLQARARLTEKTQSVFRRVGQVAPAQYLDLCDDEWRSVRITSKSWQVGHFPEARFVRAEGMQSLPLPTTGGSVEELRRFLPAGLSDDAWRLVVAYLAMALQPTGPYPILVLQGPAGAGKSTLACMVRNLVDPSKAPLTSLPRKEDDLLIAAQNSWVLGFDNVSNLSPSFSDALCRLATGAGSRKRRLYTDAEEVIFEGQRPVILNGIGQFIWREDLLSRSLIVELSEVPDGKRLPEKELWASFEAARGRILGALLDATVRALRECSKVSVADGPRLMDFALWGIAFERALGWPAGSFMAAYRRMLDTAALDMVENNPFAAGIVALLQKNGDTWEGTATQLLQALNPNGHARGAMPRGPEGAARALQRSSNILRRLGITWERHPRGRERRLSIKRLATVATGGDE